MKDEKIATPIECIIFNCDNVLLNTETIIISVLLDKAEEYGFNMELDKAVSLFSEKGIEKNILQFGNLFGAGVPRGLAEGLRKKIEEELRYGLDAKEGVREMLERLKVPFCIASDAPREEIEFNLRLTSLLEFFTSGRIFTSCETTDWNPGTGLCLHAAKSMGYKVAECAVIVDSIEGIKSGIEGGFNVYALTNGLNKKEMADGGAVVLEEIKELSKLLKFV